MADMGGLKVGVRKSVQGLSGGEKMSSLQCRPHYHRRSPSLRAECSSSASGARALRQSVSFSSATTPQPKPARQNSIPRRVEDAVTDNSVQVLIRARPVSSAEIARRCVRQENAQTISWLGLPETRFTFDHVAGEFVTQDEVFRIAGLPMVDNCMAGYNSCMFAYGQTGSGKTHTMLGDVADSENRGMTPRVFEYLFAKMRKEEEAQKQTNLRYKCRCSFLEIYNEQISDLLQPASTNLQMREDSKKGVFVERLLEVEVRNVEDVLHLLLLGAANRKVAATNMNRESSRSHSVLTCVIESQWECDSAVNFRFRRLNLVDLAGSERNKDTGVDDERLREAAGINKSLSTLGLVIMVLVDIANGKHRHVPYRDSKLTFLLQDSLGGNSKTTIIANISPSCCASSETLSTLRFAQRAKFIQNNAIINEELASGDVKELQEKIHQLKDELARVRRQSVSPEPEREDASVSPEDARGGWSPSKGSFLQFGRGATVLNHKVKQQENIHKAKSQQESREQGTHSEAEERSSLQAYEKRETMMVRKRLLDRNISMERSLSECRMKLQISVKSNERIASEVEALRLELEGLNEECRKHKQDLATLRLKKALEINCLELNQAQHYNVVLELKTQLQMSEEKAEQEKFKRNQIEVLLREALQESTNLQTELQWTRDSLEGAEAVMEKFQDLAYNNCPKHEMISPEEPCYAKEKRKIKHQEAVLQLQMELAFIDSPDDTTAVEESPGAIDMETSEGEHPNKTEEKASTDQLQETDKHNIPANKSENETVVFTTTEDARQQTQQIGTEGVSISGNENLGPLELESQDCRVLKAMVLNLDKENADLQHHLLETEARTRELKSQVEMLQLELEKLQPLRNEMALLHTSRGSSAIETERLQEEVKRKQCAIEALEEHLLNCEQSKLQCQEELQRCELKAEEKQVEAEILGKTVEELETTVYALESQVGLLKRQCSVRETMERELQELRQQNVNLLGALSQKISARAGNEVRTAAPTERKLEEREAEIQSLRKKHQTSTQRKMSSSNVKKMNLGSAFRWFKLNPGQVHSELDEERKAYERHIQELEHALKKRQLEIIALQEKLADAERVTRDIVLLVLRGVKVDMADAADEDVERMLTQLNNFIDERESWLEIISRKQAELIAAHMSDEKLREHEKTLVAENRKSKATGMSFDCNITAGSPSVSLEAIEQTRIRLETVQLELDDFKLKTKIVEEKQKLRGMRLKTTSHESPPSSGIDSHSVKPR